VGSDEDRKLALASCALTSVAVVSSPLLTFEGAAREPSETFIRTTSAAAKSAASWAARRARRRRDSRSPHGPRAPWDSSAARGSRSGWGGASRRSFVTASGVSLIALSVLLRGRRWRGGREDVRFGERPRAVQDVRSEEHTSELQSPYDLVCRLLLEKKKNTTIQLSPTDLSS